jgi:transposase
MLVTEPVRRFEVFTGAGRRRRWSDAEKVAIVAESYGGVESVCAVARRHGLASTQLFTWRKEARDRSSAFVPVLVEEPARAPKPRRPSHRHASGAAGKIELEFDSVKVRRRGDAADAAADGGPARRDGVDADIGAAPHAGAPGGCLAAAKAATR